VDKSEPDDAANRIASRRASDERRDERSDAARALSCS
jgi:hypothetical protein